MNNKVLHLHVGLHKTGTTSFQNWLVQRADDIEAAGLVPFLHDFNDRRSGNASVPFMYAFGTNNDGYEATGRFGLDAEAEKARYRSLLANLLTQHDHVVASGEDISRLTLAEMRDLRAFAESFGHRVRPLAVLRSPYEMFTSQVQQKIKHSAPFKPSRLVGWQQGCIERLNAAFDDVVYVQYEHAMADNGVVQAIVDALQLDVEVQEEPHKNASISANAADLLQFLSSVLHLHEPLGADMHAYRKRIRPLWNIPGPKFGIDQTLFDEVADQLDSAAQSIGSLLNTEFGPPATFSTGPTWTQPDLNRTVNILRRVDGDIQVLASLYFRQVRPLPDRQRRTTLIKLNRLIEPDARRSAYPILDSCIDRWRYEHPRLARQAQAVRAGRTPNQAKDERGEPDSAS